ncbi:MAG TPA: serine hydrolase domain-containing protein [Mycobacteriales bacterium]|nr:serine hydrolase domain-containing protein [Mycobacteriales bacterium]
MDALRLSERLSELARRHEVPGASIAVLAGGAVTEAACGTLNRATGVEATTDSLFQIGSITKVYTATVVMRLAERGDLALDEPVVSYLPEFAVADPDTTKQVTVRHLLAHTSGIDGDHFADTGRGDDCLERYVETLAEVRQNHALGATMSYCNAGYAVLGRLIERVTGKTWDAALAELLIEPLGLTHTVTLPEEALRFRAAIGHVGKPGEEPQPAPIWGLMRSAGPAGLICARAADVIGFARMHLDAGVAPDGARLLEAESVAAMQQPQVAVPDRWTLGDHWGLGWILFNWAGRPVYGHDGNTIGQSAFLRIVPDANIAIALLTNGGRPGDLYQDIYRELLGELADLEIPRRPEPPAEPVETDLSRYVGRYERAAALIEVTERDGRLELTVTSTGPLADLMPEPVQRLTLTAVDATEHLFVTRPEGAETWMPVVFFALPDGGRYVHFGARATAKVG